MKMLNCRVACIDVVLGVSVVLGFLEGRDVQTGEEVSKWKSRTCPSEAGLLFPGSLAVGLWKIMDGNSTYIVYLSSGCAQ
ncbi:hypothetical protein QR685DRAFT_509222 [Neurospora intermedia]|uniref:Uncharacterized protein n=1 Tax=Neurospora intermedia TaxID=5142 RepID=A0ABR3DNK1_NEUIN